MSNQKLPNLHNCCEVLAILLIDSPYAVQAPSLACNTVQRYKRKANGIFPSYQHCTLKHQMFWFEESAYYDEMT